MLPQLRRSAQSPSVAATLLSVFDRGDDLGYELREHLDQQPAVFALHVLKGGFPVAGQRRLGAAGGQRGERHSGEGIVARELVDGKDEVGLAREELVVDGEDGDGVADVERVSVADDAVREPEHELPGELLLGQELGGAAPEDELDEAALGGGVEARRDPIAHD